jgi:two-component system sensor histidine kinase/response regulator
MDGLETIRRLRARSDGPPPPKAVLITGADRTGLPEEELKTLDGFLTKPIDPSSLYNAVITAIASGAPSAPALAPITDANLGKGYRLLVAEDNAINQAIIRELLEDSGFLIDVAGDGSSALAAADANRYDAILMDIHMPMMDGVEATRRLRADPRHRGLPIIALTADVMVESAEVFHAAGMDDVVAKPIDVAHLLQTLGRHLRGRRPVTQAPAWDRDGGIRRTGGNTALYLRLLDRFVAQERDVTARIRAAMAAGERTRADGLAHALKGVAGNLGLIRIAAAAGALHDHWFLDHPGDAEVLLRGLDEAVADTFSQLPAATVPPGVTP